MTETISMQRSGLSRERLDRLSRVLQDYVERGEIAGMVALIHRHGEEAYAESVGWQDKDAQIPMQRDTIFRLMSMTKPVTAVAALMLVEEGRIRLYDSVEEWLPELANRKVLRDPAGSLDDVYPAPRSITLHDLLTYRLGIGWGDHQLQPRFHSLVSSPLAETLFQLEVERFNPDSWMARLSGFPLLYAPGERWLYHIASDVLGVLIVRITGQPLDVFFRERIFEPLGMVDTGFMVPEEKHNRFSVAYAPAPSGGLTVLDRPQSRRWVNPPSFPSGGGGLVSTADDYLRFARMLLNRGELDGVRLLSRKTVEAMTTDYLTPEQHTHSFFDEIDFDQSLKWTNQGFGYGVQIRIRQVGLGPSVGSFFWPGALGTTWLADPQEDLVAILLFQLAGAQLLNLSTISQDFWTLTYQAITD